MCRGLEALVNCTVTGSTLERNLGGSRYQLMSKTVNYVTELEVCPQSRGDSFGGFEQRMACWERRRQK